MATSITASSTFTITDARYVASKMGADLRNLNARYNRPAADTIDDFVLEAAMCLKAGYLKSVDFGFKKGNEWILRLRYTAVAGGQLRDNAPGGLPAPADVTGFSFYSYLIWNDIFLALTTEERETFRATLPFLRGNADEPTTSSGRYGSNSEYSRHGTGLSRDVYSAF
jgi:Bacterial HORMA domain family 1